MNSPSSGIPQADNTPVTAEAVVTAAANHLATVAAQEPCINDDFGLTYTGPRAHLMTYVLVRGDLSPELPQRARDAAQVIERWFTCPQITAENAAAFAELTPWQVAQIVAYVASQPQPAALELVGPATVNECAAVLLSDRILGKNGPDLLAFRDHSTDGLAGGTLNVQVAAISGRGTIPLVIAGHVHEEIIWPVPPTTIEIPVAVVVDVLRYRDDSDDVNGTLAPFLRTQLTSPTRQLGDLINVAPVFAIDYIRPGRRTHDLDEPTGAEQDHSR